MTTLEQASVGPRACCCATRGPVGAPPLSDPRTRDMVRVPSGSFRMGSDRFYREERPVRRAEVNAFWIDVYPVTNAQFATFVAATGYVTSAEREPDRALYPDADPALLVPGSLVFTQPERPVSLRDHRAWWAYVPHASWRHPYGPDSSIEQLAEHPVVHVSHEDACAFAAWCGKALPTEAEWERAARGGLEDKTYPWGDEFAPDGQLRANIWLGQFPWQNLKQVGCERTTAVKSFPPNAYGLYDMVGNVWEWTCSSYASHAGSGACCGGDSQVPSEERRTVKGGSHLCAPNYCLRYRPAARQGQTVDTSTSHIGFRCVVRD